MQGMVQMKLFILLLCCYWCCVALELRAIRQQTLHDVSYLVVVPVKASEEEEQRVLVCDAIDLPLDMRLGCETPGYSPIELRRPPKRISAQEVTIELPATTTDDDDLAKWITVVPNGSVFSVHLERNARPLHHPVPPYTQPPRGETLARQWWWYASSLLIIATVAFVALVRHVHQQRQQKQKQTREQRWSHWLDENTV